MFPSPGALQRKSVYLCIFDRLIKQSTKTTAMRGYQKGLCPKYVVNWAAEPYMLIGIWHVTFGMFLPSDQTNLHWPCSGLQLLEQSKATAIRMSRFCLHGLFRDVLFWSLAQFQNLRKPFTPWFHCLSLPSKHQRQHLWSHQKCRINNAGV